MPAATGPANVVLDFPVRVYAQLTVAGSDLWALATTQSLGSVSQLTTPLMHPGTYGQVLRWGGLNTTFDNVGTIYISQGTSFSAGYGSILQMNTTGATTGTIAAVGVGHGARVSAPATSLRNAGLSLKQTAQSKPYEMQTWFDLAN
jgi:hypothetical protein